MVSDGVEMRTFYIRKCYEVKLKSTFAFYVVSPAIKMWWNFLEFFLSPHTFPNFFLDSYSNGYQLDFPMFFHLFERRLNNSAKINALKNITRKILKNYHVGGERKRTYFLSCFRIFEANR